MTTDQIEQLNMTTQKAYMGGNQTALQNAFTQYGYKLPEWCTFNQACALGLVPAKGSKGVALVYVKSEVDPETGKTRQARKNFTVFNVSQLVDLAAETETALNQAKGV